MNSLVGYRTIGLNLLFTLVTTGGIQAADLPPAWRATGTVIFVAWGIGGVLLRIATKTPVGKKVEDKIAADVAPAVGTTPDQVETIIAKYLPQGTITDIPAKLAELTAAVKAAAPQNPTQQPAVGAQPGVT